MFEIATIIYLKGFDFAGNSRTPYSKNNKQVLVGIRLVRVGRMRIKEYGTG